MKELKKYQEEADNYAAMKMKVLARVNRMGRWGSMMSWERAYPEINWKPKYYFETESGDTLTYEVNWEERSVAEKVFYVLYSQNPEAIEISYELDLNGMETKNTVDDANAIWGMWIDGCFVDDLLCDEAKRNFVSLALGEDVEMDPSIGIKNIKVKFDNK